MAYGFEKASVPDVRVRVEHELDRIAALPANWDAQGAERIAPEIVAAARRLASLLPASLDKAPSVVPLSRGSLQFEWNEGPRCLELEFESPTVIRYLKWHPGEGTEEEESFPADDIAQAEALIRWFVRGAWNA